ncbi:MAG: hypothetical protein HUK05_04815 [Prevotella sp.]|nr:hypothetical protein [Prevotella sp.]MCF0208020.1 hypothetical protein [Bacteroidaceae bacterium]
MVETMLLTLAIVAVAVVFLSVKVLLKPKGKFSSQHVSDNPALRKQGIHCVMKQDKEAREAKKFKLNKE